MNARTTGLLAIIVTAVGFLAAGLLIGRFAIPRARSTPVSEFLRREDPAISSKLSKAFKVENIEGHLRNLTSKVHRAGTSESLAVAEYIAAHFHEVGLDLVEKPEFDVLVSLPDIENPDTVSLIDSTGAVFTTVSTGVSKYYLKEERVSTEAGIRFNAYAKNGTVTAKRLVYANYGSAKDFTALRDAGISLEIPEPALVLIRYGNIWRGNKVANAQKAGAAGVLFYSDPFDYSNSSIDQSHMFPHTVFMPDEGAQRGSLLNMDGDPLTLLLPAENYTARRTIDSVIASGAMPSIPVTPIGYADAAKLFEVMDGQTAPDAWKGALNVTYRMNGTMDQGRSVRLTVNTQPMRRKIRNVIGYIKGEIEPDRYVILGNHHDAWTYGSVDPNAGTSVMLEIARVYRAVMNETGWRPRRSILFCAWDAEEPGLLGSVEWVEQNLNRLSQRGLAYLNTDVIAGGNETFKVSAFPTLEQAYFDAAKAVDAPPLGLAERKTVWDMWLKTDPAKNTSEPAIHFLGSGSDFEHFADYVGIPSGDHRFARTEDTYPLYHTLYETFYLPANLSDVGFLLALSGGRFWAELARQFADSLVVPFSVDRYGMRIRQYADELRQDFPEVDLYGFAHLDQASIEFSTASVMFQHRLKSVTSEQEIRLVNDAMLFLDRSFIQPGGLPRRPDVRHTIFAPSTSNMYSGGTFAGVRDALANLRAQPSNRTKADLEQEIKEQLSWVVYGLKQAVMVLDDSNF